MAYAKIAVALLGAGQSTRFGRNKLEAIVNGKMLGTYAADTLAAMDFGHLIAICNSQSPAFQSALEARGFATVLNTETSGEQSHSLALAVHEAMKTEASALLICLADMPFIAAAHINKIIAEGAREDVVASAAGSHGLPPALFARSLWPSLLTLKGDQGARGQLSGAKTVSCDAHILQDIDIQADLSFFGNRL